MLAFFSAYPFLLNALIGSFLVSIVAGIIGSMVVSSKSVFLAGGVAHSAFGGVGIALFFGFSTILGAGIVAVISGLIMAYTAFWHEKRLDSHIAAIWAFGMAVGVISMDLSPGYGSDISSYLFGSIIAISTQDLVQIGIFDLILLAFVAIFYREIFGIFYDSHFCQLKNIKVRAFYTIIYVLISLGVVMSMSVGGLILVISILSIPAYIASIFAKSLAAQMWISWALSLFFIWSGFGISYAFDLSIGACVVIVSTICMGIVLALTPRSR
ncbi:MAG: metal ABC transporter permease [Helicobacter sp.]|nr:metal ABC transporter permease [Helicobacter sp.]